MPAVQIKKGDGMIGLVRLNLRVVAGGMAVAAAVETYKVSMLADAGAKEKRIQYSCAQKTSIIHKVQNLDPSSCAQVLHVAFAIASRS